MENLVDLRKRIDELQTADEPEHDDLEALEEDVEGWEAMSGELTLRYSRSVIRRDEKGRISEIISKDRHRFIRRDEKGMVVAIEDYTEEEHEA